MKTSAFPKILHIGDKQIQSLFDGEVEITEKVDGCVTPDTKILMSDFRYLPASELVIGDEVVGFDENLNGSKFRKSYITNLKYDIDEVYQISLADGRKVKVTYNHPLVVRFPGKTKDGLSKDYIEAKDIKVGMKIVDIGLWEHERSYESGYIAGQYDGEGSLVGKSKGIYGHLSYYQNEGKGALKIKDELELRGFTVGYSSRQRNPRWGVCETLRINGGLSERIRFLGIFRPKRLLSGAFEKTLENTPFNSIKDIEVVGVARIGSIRIVRISTSTKTYVADGLCSHNSQFGFGKVNGELVIRSKGRELDLEAFDKMFGEGVAYVKSIEDKIPDNMFFYGEYLQKPRHSTLAYDRIPKNHIALFAIYDSTTKEHFGHSEIEKYAERFGVDAIPLLKRGNSSGEEILELVRDRVSFLGGQTVEGVVVKAYKPWLFLGQIPQTVMSGKYVTEAFKEVHHKDWTKLNTSGGKLGVLKANYFSEARWNKAIQHLRENGELTNSPKDIGNLIKEVHRDIREEEEQNIKEQLWNIYGKDILSASTNGLPQFYKEKLVKGEIDEADS